MNEYDIENVAPMQENASPSVTITKGVSPKKARTVTSYTRNGNAAKNVTVSEPPKSISETGYGTTTATLIANDQNNRMHELKEVIKGRESSSRFTEHW